MWNAGGINTSTHTITLKTPWAGPTIPSGTKVSNGDSGGALKYIAGNYSQIDGTWKLFEGTIGGIDTSGENDYSKFHPGTASVKIGWLCNITGVGSKTWLSNISFEIDHGGEIKKTQSQITQTANKISLVVKEENGENKVDGHALVSAINVQPNTIKIESKNIDITGAVTFSSLDPNVLSTISEEASLLNINPTFSRWTSTYPEGYVLSSGSAPSKVASDNGKPNAVQYVVATGSSQYIHQDITGMGVHQYVTLEATFKLVSGALGGSGIMMRYMNSSNGAIQDCLMSFKSIVPSPILGRWYTVSKTFKASTLTNVDRYRLYVMAGWTSFGAIEAKTIQFDSVRFRPALEPEIIAYETGAKVEGWTMPGKTTINGGNIETNTIDVNRLKAGTISADTITISSATSGVTFDSTGIKATKGSTVVSMNSGVGFKITNSGQDVFRVESDGMIYAKGLTSTKEFNSLQVGARNLLRDSNKFSSSIGSGTGITCSLTEEGYMKIVSTAGNGNYVSFNMENGYQDLEDKMQEGEDFTVSFEMMSPDHNRVPAFYVKPGMGYFQLKGNMTNKFSKMHVTEKWKKANGLAFHLGVSGIVGTTYVKNIKFEKGNLPTDWTPAPEDVEAELNTVNTWITNAEQKIEPDQIAANVMSVQSFQDLMATKASTDELTDLVTAEQLDQARLALEEYARDAVGAVNLDDYVTSTSLTQTTNAINLRISSAGGVNLLQNSVGWTGIDFWAATTSNWRVIKGTSELDGLGAGSAWQLNLTTITQDVPVVAGETYTFSCYVNKAAGQAGGHFDCDEGNGTFLRKATYSLGTGYAWSLFTYTFTAVGSNARIRIIQEGASNALITNVMLNKGPLRMQWTHAKNEIYNSNVRFDLNGIVVQNNATNGETRITPTEFAGYAQDETGGMERIFTLNGDTTEVKKLKAAEEFSMGPVRILQIESGDMNGWAFLPRE